MPLSKRIKRHLRTRSDKNEFASNIKTGSDSPNIKTIKVSNEWNGKKNPVLNF